MENKPQKKKLTLTLSRESLKLMTEAPAPTSNPEGRSNTSLCTCCGTTR